MCLIIAVIRNCPPSSTAVCGVVEVTNHACDVHTQDGNRQASMNGGGQALCKTLPDGGALVANGYSGKQALKQMQISSYPPQLMMHRIM